MELLFQSAALLMCDGSLDVRQNAKRIFSILKELPEFQVSGCQLGHFIFQIGLNFANLKCQVVEMCNISSVYLSFCQLQNLSPDDLVSSLARGRQLSQSQFIVIVNLITAL